MDPTSHDLDANAVRVLGVLLEKQQTTPDTYPLTVNQVIAGCNQKTNRDPVYELSETEVVEALDRLRREVLAWRSSGPRVEKWEHSVGHRWHLNGRRKALLTLLLLRGPQTPGELKSRSERMFAFESVEQVEKTLAEMAEGPEARVRELPRVPGQRGQRWIHLLSPVDEALLSPGAPVAGRHAAPQSPRHDRLVELETKVDALSAEIDRLSRGLDELRHSLGLETDAGVSA